MREIFHGMYPDPVVGLWWDFANLFTNFGRVIGGATVGLLLLLPPWTEFNQARHHDICTSLPSREDRIHGV